MDISSTVDRCFDTCCRASGSNMRNVGLELNSSTHDGKSRGSESCGRSEVGATRLRGVLTGEDDGNAIGDELPSENASDTFEG